MTRRLPRPAVVLLAALLLAAAAPAGAKDGAGSEPTVYRCGSTYQNEPCGEGRAVPVDDVRTEAQRRQAQSVARDEARRGATMERDRLAREKAQRPAGPVGIGTAAAAAPASAPRHADKHKKRKTATDAGGKDFVAVQPGKAAKPSR